MLRTGSWKLSDLISVPKNNRTVFSCFHCGGGSTMGYKLAGFSVLGGVEIDPKMMSLYRANHNPKHSYLMSVANFKNIPDADLPAELFNLDILDGSPPCSSFSMAGSREKAWGEQKKFKEGQAHQILDNLFFDYIAIAKKLQPKVVVAENVKGLIAGNARGYVKKIFAAFKDAGYSAQLFLFNSAVMGVPQRRERTFFIANRLNKTIKLDFKEPVISAQEAVKDIFVEDNSLLINKNTEAYKYWNMCKPGENFATYHPKGNCFNMIKVNGKRPINTVTGLVSTTLFHWDEPRKFSVAELIRFQTFPEDYNFLDQPAGYVCGMSVPPYMMQRVADQINVQLLS